MAVNAPRAHRFGSLGVLTCSQTANTPSLHDPHTPRGVDLLPDGKHPAPSRSRRAWGVCRRRFERTRAPGTSRALCDQAAQIRRVVCGLPSGVMARPSGGVYAGMMARCSHWVHAGVMDRPSRGPRVTSVEKCRGAGRIFHLSRARRASVENRVAVHVFSTDLMGCRPVSGPGPRRTCAVARPPPGAPRTAADYSHEFVTVT